MKKINEYSSKECRKSTEQFLQEAYFEFRRVGLKWAELTLQTSFFPKGYLGQNLVSMVMGIQGTGTAARGDDLTDGSEVKTCSRIDQLNNCKKCNARIASYLDSCPECSSTEIRQMRDSHWICHITEQNHERYESQMPNIYFLLVDDEGLTDDMLARFTMWFITPRTNEKWRESYVNDYYHNTYLGMKKEGKNPAPMNVHPKNPKFSSINPEKIFEATVSKKGEIRILEFPY